MAKWAINQDGNTLSVSYGLFYIDGVPSVGLANQFIKKAKATDLAFNPDGTIGWVSSMMIYSIIESCK